MPAILRIDVDRNLFLKRKALPKELICFSFSTGFLFGKKKKCMIKELNNRGIKASLFFQPFTVPNKEFAQELMRKGHSVGLPAVHTKDYGNFLRGLKTGG
ncbi:MAG TPA: hypothetical protein C5S37_10910 [Methanophagales archaeon]|nr:hypothetical protein [Methanophagales archaeon]